ncbi:hypothetical protein [Nitrosomonas sp.]|uniref:DUF6988 family protein n=1 Tax=Nitrosomonas sp. TaxID=42353 RepID=UPI0025D18C52|nr:hypothetical protein [Nitrosomonas sp.]
MLFDKQLSDAGNYVEWLRLTIHERELPANNRVRASGACLAIAQDHHHAIVLLMDEHLYASSFALLRIAFEAYVRGEWLALCATDIEVAKFLKGCEPPKINCLLKDLERAPAFMEQTLSHIKERTWKTMCSYTHTGGMHVQWWNTAEAIEPNYSDEELLNVLRFAETIGSLSVLAIVTLMNDEHPAEQVLDKFKKRIGDKLRLCHH